MRWNPASGRVGWTFWSLPSFGPDSLPRSSEARRLHLDPNRQQPGKLFSVQLSMFSVQWLGPLHLERWTMKIEPFDPALHPGK
jgi:hypothetical protein